MELTGPLPAGSSAGDKIKDCDGDRLSANEFNRRSPGRSCMMIKIRLGGGRRLDAITYTSPSVRSR